MKKDVEVFLKYTSRQLFPKLRRPPPLTLPPNAPRLFFLLCPVSYPSSASVLFHLPSPRFSPPFPFSSSCPYLTPLSCIASSHSFLLFPPIPSTRTLTPPEKGGAATSRSPKGNRGWRDRESKTQPYIHIYAQIRNAFVMSIRAGRGALSKKSAVRPLSASSIVLCHPPPIGTACALLCSLCLRLATSFVQSSW